MPPLSSTPIWMLSTPLWSDWKTLSLAACPCWSGAGRRVGVWWQRRPTRRGVSTSTPPSPITQTASSSVPPWIKPAPYLAPSTPLTHRQVKFASARAIRSFTANWLASKSQTRPSDLPGPPPFPPGKLAGAVSTATGDATILGDAASGPRGHCRSDPKQGLNLAYHPRPWG